MFFPDATKATAADCKRMESEARGKGIGIGVLIGVILGIIITCAGFICKKQWSGGETQANHNSTEIPPVPTVYM